MQPEKRNGHLRRLFTRKVLLAGQVQVPNDVKYCLMLIELFNVVSIEERATRDLDFYSSAYMANKLNRSG